MEDGINHSLKDCWARSNTEGKANVGVQAVVYSNTEGKANVGVQALCMALRLHPAVVVGMLVKIQLGENAFSYQGSNQFLRFWKWVLLYCQYIIHCKFVISACTKSSILLGYWYNGSNPFTVSELFEDPLLLKLVEFSADCVLDCKRH